MTHGGKRESAGRRTFRQIEQEHRRPGAKERSVRMIATDSEYETLIALTPMQRTFALLTGKALLDYYVRQANEED